MSYSESELDSNSVFMNLDTCIFLLYICTLLDNFFSIFITESIVMQAMQV